MVKILLYASIEIILGMVILYFNLKAFLLYFLIVYFINSHLRTEHLMKLMGIHSITNIIMINSLMRKLNVSNEDFKQSITDVKSKVSKKDWEILIKNIQDITGKEIIDF